MANDRFLEIAESGQDTKYRQKFLVENPPIPFDKKVCKLGLSASAPLSVKKRIETKEELYEELKILREKYAPFLENHAPTAISPTKSIAIDEFILNGDEKVTIPHFGGPMGNAKQEYMAEFTLDDFDEKAVYICFKGADYKAFVYVNDTCVGIHEGFFSPFEFEITDAVKKGINRLKIVLENDFVYMGNSKSWGGESSEGDKLYAATGLGFDDPYSGWHHCPPGMGIYGKVSVEVRNRINITDLFVKPDISKGTAEVYVEVENADYIKRELTFELCVYGQNFKETVFENLKYVPFSGSKKMVAEHGKNLYRIPVTIPDFKVWDLDTPYLYKVHALVLSGEKECDKKSVSFGMRSFYQDTESEPKGMFYLNGRPIRLRGVNTMGFEQQDVLRGDFNQLIDDILLAKLCNFNFFRLTQRPVQNEVYDYCDMLGLMTQTDLPLFAVMRKNKFSEGVRQAEEMACLVRKHPCNVVISYINEPFLNVDDAEEGNEGRGEPHRHLTRDELESFFIACDNAVSVKKLDSVIKHIDGDYMPPDLSGKNCMPDNHCYNLWYHRHGIEFGPMYKGNWQKTLPGWYYGCGEYGAEGLDFPSVMRKYYPKEWLKEPFDPKNVLSSQTKGMHHMFFDTADSLEEWSEKSQRHQAFAMKHMTECMRRDSRFATLSAFHFIDAWPAGWMKAIMDVERSPKPAYFAVKNALEPLMVSLRCDKLTYFENETVSIEAYICNDTLSESQKGDELVFELFDGDEVLMSGRAPAYFDKNTSSYVVSAEFNAPEVSDRKKFVLRATLISNDEPINYSTFAVEVFKDRPVVENDNIVLISDLEVGEHEIAGETVTVSDGKRRIFVSRKTNHPVVREFSEFDFSMWYDEKEDMIMPLLKNVFEAKGFTPILLAEGTDSTVLAAGVKEYMGKKYVISMLDLRQENPVAKRFLENLYNL